MQIFSIKPNEVKTKLWQNAYILCYYILKNFEINYA